MFANTGAGYAFSRVDLKQCVVGGALNQLFIEIEKLIFLPLQVSAGVWATIDVGKKLTVLFYEKYRSGFTSNFKLETFAAGVFDIAYFAKIMSHNVW